MSRPSLRIAALAALAGLASALVVGPAAAQSPERPQLVIGMTGGFLTGPRLWRLARQSLPVEGSSALDSVTLQRLFRTGFVAGVGASLYRSPHVGYSVEIAFLGLSTESRCAPLGPYSRDDRHVNEQTCLTAQGRGLSTNAATFQAGLTLRARPQTALQPYVRGMAGAALLGGSFVTTDGFVVQPATDTTRPAVYLARSVLYDPKPRRLTWIATLALGASLRVDPGYSVRFELRDVILSLPVATGPAPIGTGLPSPPIGSRTVHLPTFTVALDLLMERTRTRRY